MFSFSPQFKRIALMAMMVIILIVPVTMAPRQAHAQNVPIGTDFDFNNIMAHLHDFVLKGLATSVARMILQQMTTSVVKWINSGFKGSPAFITDPAGYFQNAGDQVAGAFLSQYGGPLSQLCSPFSYDIRVGLALSRAQANQTRYTCTLSSIITNVQNGAKNATLNGASIGGFVGGNFSQGGWPAFISMTTEPQNNIYGASQQAQSDLNAQIGLKSASINLDLTRSGGFLSYPTCTTLATVDPTDQEAVDEVQSKTEGDTTVSTVTNKDGTVTYQSCTVATPGSVISGALNKQLGAPVDQLNLTNDINQIFSSLFATLVSSVLSGGLHSYGSNTASAQTFTAYNPTNLPNSPDFNAQKQALAQQLSGYNSNSVQYQTLYQQAYDDVQAAQTSYVAARTCFSTKLSSGTLDSEEEVYANAQITLINDDLESKVQPLLTTYQNDLNQANSRADSLNNVTADANNITTTQDISNISTEIKGATLTSPSDVQAAQNDVATAQAQSSQLQSAAGQYQNNCANIASSFTSNTP